ncbi:MAG: hypothetical protein AAF578_10330 [Pseudomonadota bacterium]
MQKYFLLAPMLLSAACEGDAECDLRIPEWRQRTVEPFEEVFDTDLSDVGVIEDYSDTDGFWVEIAKRVGITDVAEDFVTKKWPDKKPLAIVRYQTNSWVFLFFEAPRKGEPIEWSRWVEIDLCKKIVGFGEKEE